ncbi:MAG: Cu(I)-responsive transcriptional regulator [Deltaproteobacteria bacterium CG_4_9_14_3_um_filter_63_12]|nr:MAG: Cu(I)-responsive transcriptional regulator [Deltaproteobacteria bacterium CG_4_9_14_3_um_filter_63_12]
MNIGEAAKLSGVPPKTIRYYESVGLIREASRKTSGYRDYEPKDIEVLRFVVRARSLGFSLKDVCNLLALWNDTHRSSADVKRLAMERIGDIDERIAQLESMRATLSLLVAECHGDERSTCPILDGLSGNPAPHDCRGDEIKENSHGQVHC